MNIGKFLRACTLSGLYMLSCLAWYSAPANAAPDLFKISDYFLENIAKSSLFDDAEKTLFSMGFIERNDRYFTVRNFKREQSQTIKNIEATMADQPPVPGSWSSYTSPLQIRDKAWSTGEHDTPPIVWIVAIQDGGSLHLLQPTAYLCPDRLLSGKEVDILSGMLRKKYLEKSGAKEQRRSIGPSLLGYDLLWPAKDKDNRYRLSFYTSEKETGKYQFFIQYALDNKGDVLPGELMK